MKIFTDQKFTNIVATHDRDKWFSMLSYSDGCQSFIPHGLFRDWRDEEIPIGNSFGKFYIGKCSGCGVGSTARYESNLQSIKIGRYVNGGLRLRFLLNGQHEMRTISTCLLSMVTDGIGLKNAPLPQYGDSVIKHDVWIGDEVMILGGSVIESGCVIGARSLIPPNFHSEPYGIYVGSPARLVRFRFSESIREALVDLAWWNMPISWVLENNSIFLVDLTIDEGKTLEILAELKIKKSYSYLDPCWFIF